MFTLDDIRKEYDRLDKLTGVDTKSIELAVSTRSTNRYGSCKMINHKPVKIIIADFVLKDNNENIFWDTIRHEYVHAMVKLRNPKENHGHDWLFKKGCIEVGCDPSRLATETSEIALQRREEKLKYIVYCPKCGDEWKYVKAGKVVQGLKKKRHYKCPNCREDVVLKEL